MKTVLILSDTFIAGQLAREGEMHQVTAKDASDLVGAQKARIVPYDYAKRDATPKEPDAPAEVVDPAPVPSEPEQVETRDPEPEHRDPEPAKKKTGKKAKQ